MLNYLTTAAIYAGGLSLEAILLYSIENSFKPLFTWNPSQIAEAIYKLP